MNLSWTVIRGGHHDCERTYFRLKNEDLDASVYTIAHDDDIALVVTDVKADILVGKDKTVVLVY